MADLVFCRMVDLAFRILLKLTQELVREWVSLPREQPTQIAISKIGIVVVITRFCKVPAFMHMTSPRSQHGAGNVRRSFNHWSQVEMLRCSH